MDTKQRIRDIINEKGFIWVTHDEIHVQDLFDLKYQGELVSLHDLNINMMNPHYCFTFKNNPFHVRTKSIKHVTYTDTFIISDLYDPDE